MHVTWTSGIGDDTPFEGIVVFLRFCLKGLQCLDGPVLTVMLFPRNM